MVVAMKPSQMKYLKRCFNTSEFRHDNPKCKRCGFQVKCHKARKKQYPRLKPVSRKSDINNN